MLHFLGVCAVIWMIWVIFFKKQVPQSVSPASPKAQEIFNKYRDLKPYTVEQSIIEEQLDIQLHAIKDTALYSPELIGMVNNF